MTKPTSPVCLGGHTQLFQEGRRVAVAKLEQLQAHCQPWLCSSASLPHHGLTASPPHSERKFRGKTSHGIFLKLNPHEQFLTAALVKHQSSVQKHDSKRCFSSLHLVSVPAHLAKLSLGTLTCKSCQMGKYPSKRS